MLDTLCGPPLTSFHVFNAGGLVPGSGRYSACRRACDIARGSPPGTVKPDIWRQLTALMRSLPPAY